MARMKVLINGGGIAGGVLAFWLSRLGHEITVVERFSTLRTTGLQLDLRGHGIEVLKRMGLEQAFKAKSAPEQGLQVVDKKGKRWAFFPANVTGKGPQNFTTEYEIMRGDLCHLLHDASKDKAKWVFGTSIQSFDQRDDTIEVRFADGKVDQFDLVVGADGIGSRTRKLMLGSDTHDGFHRLKDVYIAYFSIPRPIREGEVYIATQYMATKSRGIMTRRQNPNEIQVYLGCTTASERLKEVRPGDVKEEKTALTEIFQGAGWQTAEILEAMKDTDNFYCERMGLVKLDSWSSGRVTLVGDAAYCPSANTGMGTTSGFVGAYILAGEIGRHCGTDNSKEALDKALRAYDQKFRPFMDQVQKGILEDNNRWGLLSSTPLGIVLFNCLMGVASFCKVNLGNWMLREKVKDWELPEYKEMLRD